MAFQEQTRKGHWMPEENLQLARTVALLGDRRWDFIARVSGLKRSGKSCRMRWINYLRPDLKHGRMSSDEEDMIFKLHARWGNKWSRIARELPGRTDNEIKNYWRSHLKKRAPEYKMQEGLEAASGPPDLAVGERAQGPHISSSVDNGPVDSSKWQASDDKLDASLLRGPQIDDDPFATSPNEARLSEWASEFMNGHDSRGHQGQITMESTKFSHPAWISFNGDMKWEYHVGSSLNMEGHSPIYNQFEGDLFLTV